MNLFNVRAWKRRSLATIAKWRTHMTDLELCKSKNRQESRYAFISLSWNFVLRVYLVRLKVSSASGLHQCISIEMGESPIREMDGQMYGECTEDARLMHECVHAFNSLMIFFIQRPACSSQSTPFIFIRWSFIYSLILNIIY